jgi:hypothetical protein
MNLESLLGSMKILEIVAAGHIPGASDNFDAVVDLVAEGAFDHSTAAHAEVDNAAAAMYTLAPV